MRNGDALVVTPSRLGRRGEAEAEHDGRRVRVRGGIPGERAHVVVEHVSRGGPVAVARWQRPASRPHPARREAPCPIHDECGGCGLQHLREREALALKVEQARRLVGGDWKPPIPSPKLFGYRAKTFLLPQKRGRRLLLGARPPRGPDLVDTSGCGVLRPELEALASRVRASWRRRTDLASRVRAVLLRCNRSGKTQVTVVHRGPLRLDEDFGADSCFLQHHDAPGNRIHSDEEEVAVSGAVPILEHYGPIAARIPPTAFFQGNPDVAEALYLEAAGELEAGRIAELYCGSGVLGLLALRLHEGSTLVGVDRSARSVAEAGANASRNGLLDRCRFEAAPAESAVQECDLLLVNPPRAGCAPQVLDGVRRSGARKLVYLSCSPATLARDVQHLGWTLGSVRPADMFPQTPHLEMLAVFTRP